MEETFVWTSERFPFLFISHDCTSASNIPWYGNWPLVNIIYHQLRWEIAIWENPSL